MKCPPVQGRIQDLQIEGVQKIMRTQRTSRAQSPLRPGSKPGGGGGGHSQTEVVPMLVRAPQNWTLNGVIPGVKIYP